ncbi:MAG: leucine-rich repeat domain-containing protein [bacterium]|nr:leucine-rich repeat domain-containing protein [bacterium]
MNIKNKYRILPAFIALATVFCGGYYVLNLVNNPKASLLQASAANPADPTTADDSYVVEFPDENLKKAMNENLARILNTTRTDDQNITAGELRRSNVSLFYGPNSLNSKNIENLEGIQFAKNMRSIYFVSNKITSIEQLKHLTMLDTIVGSRNTISDISPLSSLTSLKTLTLDNNQITNLQPIANLTELSVLSLNSNKIEDISALQNLTKVQTLSLNSNQIESLNALSNMASLNSLQAENNKISDVSVVNNLSDSLTSLRLSNNPVADFSPLYNLNHLRTLHLDNMKGAAKVNDLDTDKIAAMPKLTRLSIDNNGLSNVSKFGALVSNGLQVLAGNQTIATVTTDKNIIANPAIGFDGKVVPINENEDAINVDANGNPDRNGGYIKLLKNGSGNTVVSWNSISGTSSFSGKFRVNYNIDSNPPVFDSSNMQWITWRKGIPFDLNDVTATDAESGIESITNNASEQGLDSNNPAAGNYTITYTAKDKAGNTATFERHIEIASADKLKAELDKITDEFLEGYTKESADELLAFKEAAMLIYNNYRANQPYIDSYVEGIEQEFSRLRADKTPLTSKLSEVNALPEYILNDPDVVAAKAAAQQVIDNEHATPQDVKAARQALIDAVEKAQKTEADAQEAAKQELTDAEAEIAQNKNQPDKMPQVDVNVLQQIIDRVQDASARAPMVQRLEAIKQAIEEKRKLIEANQNQQNNQQNNNQSGNQQAQENKSQNGEQNGANAPNTGFEKSEDSILPVVGISAAAVVLVGLTILMTLKKKTSFKK